MAKKRIPKTTPLNSGKNDRGKYPQTIPSLWVEIARHHDFLLRRQNEPDKEVYFIRGAEGIITVVCDDPNIEVRSFGSAKERRAAFARERRKKTPHNLGYYRRAKRGSRNER